MSNHSYLLLTPDEAELIRQYIKQSDESDLLVKSVAELTQTTVSYIKQGIDIPGHGEAGGYEHNRHKQNYIHLNNAGTLWLITKNKIYFNYIKDMLLEYAKVYPTLTLNSSKDTNPPGRLFHQTLNENMWLMYASMAYSCIKAELTTAEQQTIETDLFHEMANLFTDTYAHDFDIVHNHGLWAVAGVGMCGLAINDIEMANKAIYGLNGDGETGGFLAQLKQLFSPDGYYMEGPYYHRFAIRPLLLLAEAIHRKRPELDIFNFQNSVIQRTTEALMATVFPNGTFPALNDSSKTIGINDEGLLVASSICTKHYGVSENLIAMAQQQNAVLVSASSIELSAAAHSDRKLLNWGSLTLNDGANGDKGGLGIIRQKVGEKDLHMALLWYGQHGSDHTLHAALDHGHFDGLHLGWFNRGQEVLQDYGYGRWVNVEPKFGGRYIPENKTYCKQTIAHNTVTVDQCSQNKGNTAIAEKHWGELIHFDSHADFGQAIIASALDYYQGVDMRRSILMINRQNASPLLVDLFELTSNDHHQYDLAVHYDGQITHSDFERKSYSQLETLGEDYGYQHLWKVASAKINPQASSAMVSWLMGDSYYSMTTATTNDTEIYFCRLGANDPNFNLRSEPSFVVRSHGKNQLFATVFEQHGYFNESLELSDDARGTIKYTEILFSDANADIFRIHDLDSNYWTVLHWKADEPDATHKLIVADEKFEWQGMMAVQHSQSESNQ